MINLVGYYLVLKRNEDGRGKKRVSEDRDRRGVSGFLLIVRV